MKHRISFVLLGLAMLVPGVALFAHHSPSAIFNMKQKVTIKGTLTKVDWVNPHIVVFMDAKDDDGNVVNWKFESNPPRWFTKVGVTRADFAGGDRPDGFRGSASRPLTAPSMDTCRKSRFQTAIRFLWKTAPEGGNSSMKLHPERASSRWPPRRCWWLPYP